MSSKINVEVLACKKFSDYVIKLTITTYWQIFNLAVVHPISVTLCVCAKILVVFNLAILCSITKLNVPSIFLRLQFIVPLLHVHV